MGGRDKLFKWGTGLKQMECSNLNPHADLVVSISGVGACSCFMLKALLSSRQCVNKPQTAEGLSLPRSSATC